MKKIITSLVLLISLLMMAVLSACGGTTPDPKPDDPERSVVEISIKQMPNKVEYFLNEEFSVEGGVILIKYTDDTTKDMNMTDPSVEVNAPNTSRVGEKTVTIKYENKKATFKVNVFVKGIDVTFDLNYEGAGTAEVKNVSEGYSVDKPTDPERAGYTFYNWYTDKNCTVEYDFENNVTAPVTLYACWKENGCNYFNVTYDFNYYGCSNGEYKQIVKENASAAELALTPERTDYRFNGWSKEAEGNNAFDFSEKITADTTIYAKWEKTKTGVSTYTFEAENVDLSQKAGPGYSGENAGSGMIVPNDKVNASGDKFVAYQCKYGNSLEFNIACDEDTDNVQLVVRFAAEFSSMTLTSESYGIIVNGETLKYQDIVLTIPDDAQQSNFEDYVIATISLKKGANLIQLKTTNKEPLGGTLTATAPIIDCLKLTTDAVVIWDGAYGLPANVD